MSRPEADLPTPLAVAETVPEQAAGRTPLFLYGTLLDREVLERLLGRRVCGDELVPARLAGFRRVRARGGPWPVLVPDPSGVVEGLLLLRPSRSDLRRIADYEDDYRACLYRVRTVGGEEAAAWLYLARPEQHEAGDEPWDPEVWARDHRTELLRMIDIWVAELEAREAGAAVPRAG